MTIPRDPNDPAIVRAPWGPEVDGRRLLAESVGFGRALRAAGIATDLGAAVDFARALTIVDMGERDTVRAAGQAVFVRRRDDRGAAQAQRRCGRPRAGSGRRAMPCCSRDEDARPTPTTETGRRRRGGLDRRRPELMTASRCPSRPTRTTAD